MLGLAFHSQNVVYFCSCLKHAGGAGVPSGDFQVCRGCEADGAVRHHHFFHRLFPNGHRSLPIWARVGNPVSLGPHAGTVPLRMKRPGMRSATGRRSPPNRREIEFDGIGRDGQVLNYAISEHVEAEIQGDPCLLAVIRYTSFNSGYAISPHNATHTVF